MPLVPHTPATEAQGHAALVVALDAGDLAGADRARAERLTASCAGCAALLADLAAIRGAMTAVPVPARSRDYRLSDEDVARLRPPTWRRLLDWLAAPGSTVRPLATGLATLGVVGLLLTAGLPNLGSSAAAPTMNAAGAPVESPGVAGAQAPASDRLPAPAVGATPAPAAAGTGALAGRATAVPAPGPSSQPGQDVPAGPANDAASTPPGDQSTTSGAPERSGGAKAAETAPATGPNIPVALVVSIALLLAGLGLFLARAIARRRVA